RRKINHSLIWQALALCEKSRLLSFLGNLFAALQRTMYTAIKATATDYYYGSQAPAKTVQNESSAIAG
ncbi:MAG: hypothetical protein ACPG4U_08220, partial [Pseudomonadales bacterium]